MTEALGGGAGHGRSQPPARSGTVTVPFTFTFTHPSPSRISLSLSLTYGSDDNQLLPGHVISLCLKIDERCQLCSEIFINVKIAVSPTSIHNAQAFGWACCVVKRIDRKTPCFIRPPPPPRGSRCMPDVNATAVEVRTLWGHPQLYDRIGIGVMSSLWCPVMVFFFFKEEDISLNLFKFSHNVLDWTALPWIFFGGVEVGMGWMGVGADLKKIRGGALRHNDFRAYVVFVWGYNDLLPVVWPHTVQTPLCGQWRRNGHSQPGGGGHAVAELLPLPPSPAPSTPTPTPSLSFSPSPARLPPCGGRVLA